MSTLATVLVAAVALIHVYIVVLEMVLWTTPRGRAAFGLTPEFAESTKALAANQGLYNGFLAAGLVWGLVGPDHLRSGFQVFFLLCVIVAGLYGAATASRKILLVQALPGALALAAVLLASA
jgi:putative membrane protein